MRMTSNAPSGSVIYGEGRIGNLASATPTMAGCSWESPTSSRALAKRLRKPRSLGLPPKPSGHLPPTPPPGPGIMVQELDVTGEPAGSWAQPVSIW